ncbi:hypothetical protein GQ600_26630 [Phytophthora cactorum]|nr:hypothetical protein GQ600_26630 [Phytophthora cactorum]
MDCKRSNVSYVVSGWLCWLDGTVAKPISVERNAKCTKSLCIKLHVSPEALKAGTISRETIRKSVEYHGYLVHAEAHGRKPDPPPKQLQQIINLRKGLRTSESVLVFAITSAEYAQGMICSPTSSLLVHCNCFYYSVAGLAGIYSIAVTSGEVSQSTINEANAHLLPNRAIANGSEVTILWKVHCILIA